MKTRKKRWRETSDRDKTWAETMEPALCRCGHLNTIHAGGIGDCAFPHCVCQEFKEKML